MSVLRLSFAVCVFALSSASLSAAPVWLGREGVQYATATNPSGLEFDAEGYLYAGHSRNNWVYIYRIPPGGGPAEGWGTQKAVDPDAICIYGDYVYSCGKYNIWQTHRTTGQTEQWTDWSAARNMTAITFDAQGDYADPGDVFIASARRAVDVELVDAETRTPAPLVSSADLYIPRGLNFVQGRLYCVESDASVGIWEISAAGELTRFDDGGFAWQAPNSLAYHAVEDAFYAGDGARGEIVRVPRTGGSATVVAWGFDSTAGLTFDSAGNLYVSDAANDVIWQMPVPEPSTLALLGMGAAGLLGYAWRTRCWR